MNPEPEVMEGAQHGPAGLCYCLTKGPVSVDVYEDAAAGSDTRPFVFWVTYHDDEADMSWGCATLGKAIEDGKQALDEAWERYVAEGGP
jgi:hypothetical protein